jgi:N-acetylmuramoyl-L-alanine amidase
MAGIKNEAQTIREYNAYFGADLFVSVHCNASLIGETVGTEVRFYSSSVWALAECLQK